MSRSQRSVPKRQIGQVAAENVQLCLPSWAICRHALRIGFDEQSSLRGAYEGCGGGLERITRPRVTLCSTSMIALLDPEQRFARPL
jgi:hypothetical protein